MWDIERKKLNNIMTRYGYDIEIDRNTFISTDIDSDNGVLLTTSTPTTLSEKIDIKGFIITTNSKFNILDTAIITDDKKHLITMDDENIQVGDFFEFDSETYKILSIEHRHIYFDATLDVI